MPSSSPPHRLARLVSRLLAGATDIRRGEGRDVLVAGLLFFLILSAMMVLRPVREAMGLKHGVENVRRLFLCTVGATVVLVPAFGYLVSRMPRRAFLSVSFRCCGLILLGFYLVLTQMPRPIAEFFAPVYYVSYSVINLFVVSLFWALMADLFHAAESKRLFPAIAVGGTLGAITGSLVAELFAQQSAGHIGWLFLISVAQLELAVWIAALVTRMRTPQTRAPAEARPIGGHPLGAVVEIVRSPYLMGIGLFILLGAMISAFFYLTGMRIVAAAAGTDQQRTMLFAQINVWTQVATLLAQAFVAGRIMRLIGVGSALAVLPVCSAAGFQVLALTPTLTAYMLINATYRAAQRGIARPAQETLFTVVPREEKYKAKSFLDTFVFRAGDASGAQLERPLVAAGLKLAGLATAVLPIALGWAALCLALGVAQSRRARREAQKP